jgi:hypothetical protein
MVVKWNRMIEFAACSRSEGLEYRRASGHSQSMVRHRSGAPVRAVDGLGKLPDGHERELRPALTGAPADQTNS